MTDTIRYRYRCMNLTCRRVWQVEFQGQRIEDRQRGKSVMRYLSSEGLSHFDSKYMYCPKCDTRSIEPKPIQGRHDANRPCDSRCIEAVGTTCVCSCGGANHGVGWLYDFRSAIRQGFAISEAS